MEVGGKHAGHSNGERQRPQIPQAHTYLDSSPTLDWGQAAETVLRPSHRGRRGQAEGLQVSGAVAVGPALAGEWLAASPQAASRATAS